MHGLECGSHAAAPVVLTIRRGLQRTPVPIRNPDDEDDRTQAGSLPHSVLVPVVCRGGFRRGGFSTRPYGRCLCHSPCHTREFGEWECLSSCAMDGFSDVISSSQNLI
ncbi:MAG TPA: hypothetical protein DEF43_18715 [Chloroflexus aurantiacus]|nr:MAG: hypothetical protein D6716_09010 [Chloroflexota bacterium]HBW69138.1 hypothetical protein [Chloroflexus aurantiacus]